MTNKIDALIAEIDTQMQIYNHCHYVHHVLDKCKTELQTCKGALEELLKLGTEGMRPDYGEWLTFHDKVAQIANKALSTNEKEPHD